MSIYDTNDQQSSTTSDTISFNLCTKVGTLQIPCVFKLNLKFVIQHLLTNAAMRTHTKPNTNAFILLILKIVLLQNL